MAEFIDLNSALKEIERFAGYLDDDMIYRIKIALKRLPSPQKGIHWQYCKDPNDINEAIRKQDENWDGLFYTSQIISITYDSSQGCYVVFWRA